MIDPVQVVEAVVVIALGSREIVRMLRSRHERRETESAGLQANPARCVEHTRAINELRDDIRMIKERLGLV